MTTINTQLFTEFPELASLSREDLDDLLVDPTYFHAIFHSLPQVKALFQAQSELGMANESLAKRNVALQDEVYRLRSETKEAFDDAKNLQARWKDVDREQKEQYQRYSPAFLLLRLRHATTAQDDLSESISSSFIRRPNATDDTSEAGASEKDINEFVRQFKDVRKTYHKRAMWGEQWAAGKVSWRED